MPRTIEVVDQHDALAGDDGAVGAVLEPDAELADMLGRLDEGAPDIVVADDAELVGDTRLLGISYGGGNSRVRDRYDDIGCGGSFTGQLRAAGLADVVDAAAADDRVRPGEVDIFEDARTRRHRLERLVRMSAFVVEDQDFAVLDVAHMLRADDVERAGLRRQDRATVQLAEHQRPDAERIAGADQLFVGQSDKGVGAFEGAQPFDEAIDKAVAVRPGHEVKNDLGIGGRLHHRAFAHQIAAQRDAVGQVAVVADGKAAGVELGEQRLDIAQNCFAGRRIAHMADRGVAGEAVDHLTPGEGVADQAEPPFGMEPLAVERNDTGGFLAAVLQGVQAERGDGRGVRVAENAENAALLAQTIRIRVEGVRFGHRHRLSTTAPSRFGRCDHSLRRHDCRRGCRFPHADPREERYPASRDPPVSWTSACLRWCSRRSPATAL